MMVTMREFLKTNGDWCLMFDDYGNLFLGNQPQQYLGEQAGHHLNKGSLTREIMNLLIKKVKVIKFTITSSSVVF